jgi:hypothetical protein
VAAGGCSSFLALSCLFLLVTLLPNIRKGRQAAFTEA